MAAFAPAAPLATSIV